MGLNVNEGLAGKGDELTILDYAILTSVSVHYNWLCPVIVHEGGLQQHGAYSGLHAQEGCVSQEIPSPFAG